MRLPIAFVDDMELMRGSLSEYIESRQPLYKVYQYCNGKDLVERLPQEGYQPQLVLMDISMPIMNGYEATEWLKARYPKVPVLVVSMHNNEMALIKMYCAGANGFITKNYSLDVLFEAMEEVRKGNFYFNIGNGYQVVKGGLYQNGKKITVTNVTLTDQEQKILKLMASDKSYKEIAEALSISSRTIDTHKRNISLKLDIHTREGLILYAISMGLVQ